MRPAHLLKPNKAQSFPTRIVLFDTETTATPVGKKGQKHTLRLGVACLWTRRSGNEKDTFAWHRFTDPGDFWDWLLSHHYAKTRVVLSSHNLSFDVVVLNTFSTLPARGYELVSYYCKGTTTLCRFKCKGKRLDFVDNTNFFSAKLADLATLVGLEKLEVDFSSVSDEELYIYCRRDVEILVRLWAKWFAFLDDHELGRWSRTLPSQAFSAFRHRFMDKKILIHSHEKCLKLERKAYHGGRVEVLRVGSFTGGPFFKLDVNSMYAYAMQRFLYPVSLYHYEEDVTVPYVRNKLLKYSVVADCLIETSEPAFPIPVHGHTTYPVGTFQTALSTPELKYLLATGKLLRVFACSYYRSAPIFRSYVDYFYPLKEKYHLVGQLTYRAIAKGFLNFLYGKFGQRGLKDTILGDCNPDIVRIVEVYDSTTGEKYELIQLAGKVIRRDKEDEAYNSFPAIAAEVTANARMRMHSLITQAGRRNVFYLDTDSLIVSPAGYNRLLPLVHETRLGALRLEGVSNNVEIRALKDYTFGEETRIKGIRSTAEQLSEDTFQQEKFPSIQGLLRRGTVDDYVVTTIQKILSREIYSGVVDAEGFVTPFRLPLSFPSPSQSLL